MQQTNGSNGIVKPAPGANLSPLELEVERLRQENDRLNERIKNGVGRKERPLTFKVGEKGGVVVSGLQRFPTTLTPHQWRRLAAKMPEVLAFAAQNQALCDALHAKHYPTGSDE